MIKFCRWTSFCGVAYAHIDFTSAVIHLIKGPNASGKTSLADGMRFCLVGEPGRVALKGQYKYLVKEGEKKGQVMCGLVHEGKPVSMSRTVPKAELEVAPEMVLELPSALPYVLDAQRLAGLPAEQRRVFLRELMGVKAKKQEIMKRLRERECDPEGAAEIMPLLRSATGFEDAEKFAKRRATEARAGWKLLTGENYGEKKAATWKPDVQPLEEGVLEQAKASVAQAEARVGEALENLNAAKRANEALPCPHCGGLVIYTRRENSSDHQLVQFDAEPSAADELPQCEGEMQKAVMARGTARDQLQAIQRHADQVEDASRIETQALQAHESVKKWSKLAEALGPDGIPGELLTEVLEPLNEHLRVAAVNTGWPQVRVKADMAIFCGDRWYPLLSESERWRADAMLAEAISSFGDLGILILDRLDVLQPKLRKTALKWLSGIKDRYQLVVLFATMESDQVGIRGGIHFHQLQAGRLADEAEAAA